MWIHYDLLCRKQSGSRPTKKTGWKNLFLPPHFFFFSMIVLALISPLHTIHAHNLWTLQSRFPSSHPTGSDFTHPPLPHRVSFIYLHSFTGSFQATKLRSPEERWGFFEAVVLASVMMQAKTPVSECCSLCNCFRTAKIQTLWFSFMPCHYRLLEK